MKWLNVVSEMGKSFNIEEHTRDFEIAKFHRTEAVYSVHKEQWTLIRFNSCKHKHKLEWNGFEMDVWTLSLE